MIFASNITGRRSKFELRAVSYPPISNTLMRKSSGLIVFIKWSSKFIASIITETKQFIFFHKNPKRYLRVGRDKSTQLNARHIALRNIPKVQVEIFCSKPSSKVSILMKSKSGSSIEARNNNSSYKRALK